MSMRFVWLRGVLRSTLVIASTVNAALAALALSPTPIAVAASTSAPASGVFLIPGGGTKNVAGVIDRPISRSLTAPASEAAPTQFNRLADHTAFTAAPEAAVDPDGGPALYTILQRAPAAAAPARPALYAPAISQPSAPNVRVQPSNTRFCTVTEIARSTSARACR
jgi:hypothetical protein